MRVWRKTGPKIAVAAHPVDDDCMACREVAGILVQSMEFELVGYRVAVTERTSVESLNVEV